MRIIDAEALIQAIVKKIYPIQKEECCISGFGLLAGDIVHEINEQPTVNQWIPVSKKLPELRLAKGWFNPNYQESRPVLVTGKSECLHSEVPVYVAQLRADLTCGVLVWEEIAEATPLENVTAWQPLPEPYRESEDKE